MGWPAHGTRHETALGVAAFLNRGIIIVKSSAGQISIVVASEDGLQAHMLFPKFELEAPRGPRGAVSAGWWASQANADPASSSGLLESTVEGRILDCGAVHHLTHV